MLNGSGPDDVLERTRSRVHVETIFLQYLRGQLIVMRFLDECVLRSLKGFLLGGSNPFPAGGKRRTARFQALKIGEPGKARLTDKTSRHTLLARHLIRAVGNAARIADP